MLTCPNCGHKQVDVREAAEIIGVSGEMVRNYSRSGVLPEPTLLDVPGGNPKGYLPLDAVKKLAKNRKARQARREKAPV